MRYFMVRCREPESGPQTAIVVECRDILQYMLVLPDEPTKVSLRPCLFCGDTPRGVVEINLSGFLALRDRVDVFSP